MTSPPKDCSLCPELCLSRSQIVFPTPAPQGGLLCIGEAPGQKEDQAGIGFVGPAGKTLDALLAKRGMARDGYGQANICRCRPPNNRRPTKAEAGACLPNLTEFISSTKPRVLLLVGATAASYFLGNAALFRLIELSRQAGGDLLDPIKCHPAIRSLSQLGIRVVAMPHTSGMAWHRRAPTGETWCEIGNRQVDRAITLLGR